MAAARRIIGLLLVHAAAAQLYSNTNPPCNPKNCGTTCPNPIPPGPNQCCPRCRQDCRVVLCLRPPCNNPIFPPGECCGVCPVTTPPPTTSPPTTTPAPCDAVTCPPTFCPNPIPSSKPKRCCPRCRQDCRVVLCLRPPCNNPIFPPGECCGICPVTTPPPTTSPPTTTTSPPSPCDAVTCPPIYCPRPIPPRPKQCCSRCKQDCRLVRCGRPLCSNPIVPLGKCCGVCPVTPTPPTCPIKGQVYKECGSACPPTCGDPNPNCFLQCQAGCICPTGTVLDTTKNVCVPLAKCTPTCPIKGQVYKECGSACPPTCGNPNPICTLQCQAGCMCPTGTVLDTTKNVCVSQAKCTCPPTCSRDYCRKNPKSVCTNTGPREIPGCTGQCQLTLCRACYYSSSCFSRPTNCPTCYTRYTGKRLQRCLKYWAYCVRKNYHYRRVTKQQCPSGTPKFKCWNPPCPLRG